MRALISLRGIRLTSSITKNGQASKWEYKEGDKSLDGSVISHIVGREEDFIVFVCDDGACSWEHREIPDWAYVGIDQYEKLNAKIPTFLGQIHKADIKALMGTSLLSTFRSRDHKKEAVIACFNDAWTKVNEYEKRNVLLAGDGFYLYEDENQLIKIQISEPDQQLDKAFFEAFHLSQQAAHSLKNKKLSQANRLICNDFSNYKELDSKDIFSKSKSYIETQSQEIIRINYLLISISVACVAAVLFFIGFLCTSTSSDIVKTIILCSLAGIIGSTVSILQRSSDVKPEPFSSGGLLAFQGATRVFLGVVFGALVPICAEANIALGLANDNLFALFIVAFFSGINERFIPDLIKKNIN
tara:strand:- start:87 stop:1157 length:1071 start_codon:yes stop_codon:yes gene_type:complete